MAEKTLNTRISLKYGLIGEWSSTFKPLKGEVCFAEVATEKKDAAGNIISVPAVVFKVGDGEKTFEQLPWASALAADVYDWAKEAGLPVDTTKAPEGQFVEGFAWDNDKLVPKFRGFITEINEENKDKLDAPTTKAVKTYVDGAIEKAVADVVEQGTVVKAGDLLDVSQEGNVYTIAHETVADPAETPGSGRKYLTGVTTDKHGHITGFTTAEEVDQTEEEFGILTITGKDAIKITEGQNPEVSLALNTAGNVVLSQDDAGLKANIDLSAYRLIADDEDTKYGIEYDSATKKIKLTSDTTKTEIDATDFIKDGMISSVELVNENDAGKAGQFLKITWNDDAGKSVTYLDVTTLVDVYTGSTGDDIAVTVTSDKKIQATLTDTIKTTINNKKDKQTPVADPTANGESLTFIDTISQNANGEITATKKNVNLAAYALKSELPTVNDGKFTVSGTGALTGSGEMTANQAGNTTATLDLTDEVKGQINSAVQEVTAGIGIKAVKTGTTVNLEIVGKDETDDDGNAVTFILDCGGAE